MPMAGAVRRHPACIACVVAALSTLIGADQQPPRYNETVNVASVLIDVRVLDDAGRPIAALTAGDFSVKIGGKPARVQSSAWIGGETTSAAALDQVAASSAGREVPAGRLIVLLFQRSLANHHARGLLRTLEESRDLVRSLGPSDRVAILTFDTSLKMWTDFTADRAVLDRILERGVLFERPPTLAASPAPSLHLDARTARRTYTIERAFDLIAQALEPLPGSKAIAFFGWGMGSINRNGDVSVGKGNTDTSRALTAARAAVFSLDITSADTHSLAYGLQRIAEETGGFYASSLDFPERPMRWLAGALSGYYVLFVERPEHDDKARDVMVGLTGRQGHVFATSSYSSVVR
jgi:VWFA-related protein